MNRLANRIGLTLIILAFFPAVALADAGTPLIWATAFRLFLGNALVGIAEGLLLAYLFRLKGPTCIAVMIAGNYFSAWVGGMFVIPMFADSRNLDLHNAQRWLWGMVVTTYFVTLVLEWPFVAICLRKSPHWFRKSIWGSLVVQTASYLVLFGWYWAASGKSLYTDLATVQPSEISLPADVTVYYVGEDDRGVFAHDLAGEEARQVFPEKLPTDNDRLLLRESRVTPGRWDLLAGSTTVESVSEGRILVSGLECAVADPPTVGIRPGGPVPRFHQDKGGWEFSFGRMMGNLHGENSSDGRTFYLSLETLFLQWPVCSPTQLPNGMVVFQLGRNQICAVDPNTRKVALLAKGRWPVVTMSDK